MTTYTIEGGTVLGDTSRTTTLRYKKITFKAPVIEIRSGSKDGPLLAQIETTNGNLDNTGERHEGVDL